MVIRDASVEAAPLEDLSTVPENIKGSAGVFIGYVRAERTERGPNTIIGAIDANGAQPINCNTQIALPGF